MKSTCSRLICCFCFGQKDKLKEVPLIMLRLPICGQVGEEIEAYMNCLVENIENFDNGGMEGLLK